MEIKSRPAAVNIFAYTLQTRFQRTAGAGVAAVEDIFVWRDYSLVAAPQDATGL